MHLWGNLMRTFGLMGMIFWVAIVALLGNERRFIREERVLGKREMRNTYRFSIFAVLPIILWAGFRKGAGYADTNAYIRFYQTVPADWAGLRAYLSIHSEDMGFTVFTSVIKHIFGISYTPFLMITAVIQCLIVALVFRRFSASFCFSFFLFIASGDYFSWIFNGVRQFLAVTITMAGFGYLLEGKHVKYILIVLLASTIHMSALIMLPVMLVVRGKPWNLKAMLAILVTAGILLATNQFTDILNNLMRNTQYSDSVSSWNDDGTNPFRVAIHAVPTILAFVGRKQLAQQNNRVIDMCVNMSIVATMLWLVSMVTSGIYMGRLPIYAGIYNYILLPYEIDAVFEEKSARIMRNCAIILYLIFYYYQMHFAWGLL